MSARSARSLRTDGSRWTRGPRSAVWVCSATGLRVRCEYDRPLGLYRAVVVGPPGELAAGEEWAGGYGLFPAEAIGTASSKHWRAQRGETP